MLDYQKEILMLYKSGTDELPECDEEKPVYGLVYDRQWMQRHYYTHGISNVRCHIPSSTLDQNPDTATSDKNLISKSNIRGLSYLILLRAS
jgi:hypothetical protein